MNKTIGSICLSILLMSVWRIVPAMAAQVEDYAACKDCHIGIEVLDENHNFQCRNCHIMPEHRVKPIQTHKMIVRHPAATAVVDTFCGKCHRQEIDRLANSLHWTLAGIINQTRFLWGAQTDSSPRYCAAPNSSMENLPPPSGNVRSPADLVDDLLRHRCLSCHIGTQAIQKRGFFRGLGCAACHIHYDDDGIYRGADPCLLGKTGYPALHKFSRRIATSQCQHCHNGPYVGGDFSGRFQHDFHQSYRTPIVNGYLPEVRYLMDYHQLKPDVHFELGMVCIDCHGREDVMGVGILSGSQQEAVAVRCRHCHEDSSNDNAAHSIVGMEKIHCLGCHAAWGFMDYGPSLIRDDRKDLSRWSPWRLQGDEPVAALFDDYGLFLDKQISGKPGPWLMGWRFRRWEYLTLGKDSAGRIVPIRPRYQYRVSYVTRSGSVIMDNVVPERGDKKGPGWAFMPYYPHTVSRRGRSCEACHGQTLAAGTALWDGTGPDLALTKPSPPVFSSMSLLTIPEKKTLLEKTPAYRKWRFKVLWQEYGVGK